MSKKIKHIIAKIIRAICYLIVGALCACFLVLFILWVLSDPLKALLIPVGYIVLLVLAGLIYFGITALLDWLDK